MAKSPCLACPDRYVGCHSKCERYMAFKDEKKEENAVRRKQANENRIQNEIERDRIRRAATGKMWRSRRTKR